MHYKILNQNVQRHIKMILELLLAVHDILTLIYHGEFVGFFE